MPESKQAPAETSKFFALVQNPLKFKLFLFSKIPSAFFSGLRVVAADESSASVSVPFKRFTQNPFRSTYFACLSMAAEMSTGLLAMAFIYKSKPAVSMLVTRMESRFFKKADGKVVFTCNDGEAFRQTIDLAMKTREGQEFTAEAVGLNTAGEKVAEFLITWSFKVKSS